MSDFCLHSTNIKQFIQMCTEYCQTGKRFRVSIKRWVDKRTLSMNSLWWLWMSDTSDYLSANGWATEIKNSHGTRVGTQRFSADDCHEFFVNHYCGQDQNGNRVKTSKMKKGDMLDMMERHQFWCMQHKVPLRIPDDCEYKKLQKETEK